MITAPWKILHLDLSQGIPDLWVEPAYEGIYVVCWWSHLPLGHIFLAKAQLPLAPTQLTHQIAHAIAPTVQSYLYSNTGTSVQRILAWQSLLKLEKPLVTLDQSQIITNILDDKLRTISVVICTRDRPEQLEQCLRSLQELSVTPHEILVVDNAPQTEATYQLVSQFSKKIRYIKEPRPGLSIARNTGIHETTGSIVVFTDDDVVVDPDWIIRLQSAFSNEQIMAVTGLMIPGELETESQLIFEMSHSSLHGEYQSKIFDCSFFSRHQSVGVPVWRIGAGANMAFRREIFDKVGDFDERLGAGASGCSEDSEMWYRILAEGGICYYKSTATVFQYHRREMNSLNKQMFYYMRGHVTALLIQYARYKHWGNLYRLFVDLPKHYLGVLMAGIFYGFTLKQKTLFSEVLGCLAGIVFYLRHRQQS